jgi:hypothetical protein
MLDTTLAGIRIGSQGTKPAVVAYADDVTVFLTSPHDVSAVQDALQTYEQATGAKININKSKALAMGLWDTSINIINIPYCNEVGILGVRFTASINRSADINWASTTRQIQAQAKEAYIRNLYLAKHIDCIHNSLPARAWYIAQILPISATYIRQIHTAVTWYLWKGAIFRVPLSTIQRKKTDDGCNLTSISTKSRALFYYRFNMQGRETGTITAEWIKKLDLLSPRANQPTIGRSPRYLEYIRQYALDHAYIPQQGWGKRSGHTSDVFKLRWKA